MANQIAAFPITSTEMAAQTKIIFVPRLDHCIEEQVIDVAILEVFQKLGYDRPTQEQAQAIRSFVLGSDVFVMLPSGSGKSLCYASLPYSFDSLLERRMLTTTLLLLSVLLARSCTLQHPSFQIPCIDSDPENR